MRLLSLSLVIYPVKEDQVYLLRGGQMGGLAFSGREPSSDLVFLGLKLNLCFRSFITDEPRCGGRDASCDWSCAY